MLMPPFALDSSFWSISSLAPNPLQQKSREPPENAKKIPPYVPKKRGKKGTKATHIITPQMQLFQVTNGSPPQLSCTNKHPFLLVRICACIPLLHFYM